MILPDVLVGISRPAETRIFLSVNQLVLFKHMYVQVVHAVQVCLWCAVCVYMCSKL